MGFRFWSDCCTTILFAWECHLLQQSCIERQGAWLRPVEHKEWLAGAVVQDLVGQRQRAGRAHGLLLLRQRMHSHRAPNPFRRSCLGATSKQLILDPITCMRVKDVIRFRELSSARAQ